MCVFVKMRYEVTCWYNLHAAISSNAKILDLYN